MPLSIQKFSHRVSCIHEKHICESWRCNIWHIQGRDRDLVVDIGMGLWPIADHIAAIRERPILTFVHTATTIMQVGFSNLQIGSGIRPRLRFLQIQHGRTPWLVCLPLPSSKPHPTLHLMHLTGVIHLRH